MKEPTVAIPITVFLELVRLYKKNPQEILSSRVYIEATQLEKGAYRKYLGYKKALKEANK